MYVCTVIACIVIACIVIACIVIACIVVVYILLLYKTGVQCLAVEQRFRTVEFTIMIIF